MKLRKSNLGKEGFLILLYDIDDNNGLKTINKFRKKIISLGFNRCQKSIYYRYYKNISLSIYTIQKIFENAPKYSNIKFIHLTLKQFEKMNQYSNVKIDTSKYTKNIVVY